MKNNPGGCSSCTWKRQWRCQFEDLRNVGDHDLGIATQCDRKRAWALHVDAAGNPSDVFPI